MLSAINIEQYGGKAVILMYIRDKLPHLPIPRFLVRSAGQNLNSFLTEFQSMHKPVIVRSSSPHEYADFEGIFDSVANVYTEPALASAIKQVEHSALSERAATYARIHRFTIDEKIHTIIQEQSPSRLQGAMMRHPNNPDLVYITWFTGKGRCLQDYYDYVYNDKTKKIEKPNVVMQDKIDVQRVQRLVEIYQEIESLKEIGEEVPYVEFGLEPLAIYQARPFKKIQTADFSLPDKHSREIIHTDLVFGITHSDGIVLPALRSVGSEEMSIAIDSALHKMLGKRNPSITIEYGDHEFEWVHDMMNLHGMDLYSAETRKIFAKMMKKHHALIEDQLKTPYCFLASSAKREDYDVDLSIPHMKTMILGQAQNFLTHGLMRLIKQSEIAALFGPNLIATQFYKKTKTVEDQIRIISNGKKAIVMKE